MCIADRRQSQVELRVVCILLLMNLEWLSNPENRWRVYRKKQRSKGRALIGGSQRNTRWQETNAQTEFIGQIGLDPGVYTASDTEAITEVFKYQRQRSNRAIWVRSKISKEPAYYSTTSVKSWSIKTTRKRNIKQILYNYTHILDQIRKDKLIIILIIS